MAAKKPGPVKTNLNITKQQPRKNADAYGSPKKPKTINSLKVTNSRNLTPKGFTPKNVSRWQNKISNSLPPVPRTGPSSGGGARSLYNRLTGGLREHGR